MDYIKKHKQAILLVIISLIIIFTRIAPMSFGDLYGDNAINSFRAYGWLDYFGTSGQTTPLQWFGNIPGWANLSFHDAPPLVFLIQHIFFVILGGGTVIAKLPYVIAGILSIWIVYYLLKKISNKAVASITTLVYAVSSYSAWASQAAYLEGILEFFIIGSVLILAVFLFKEQNKKYIYIGAVLFACALLTKYTAIFLIPAIVLYTFLYRHELKKQLKNILLASIIFLVMLSPLIIYNVNLYQSRGHFDAALSSIVGIHSDDFSIIDNRGAHYNVFNNTILVIKRLAQNVSYPFLLLFGICLISLISRIRKAGLKSFESWILINTVFLFIILGFTGGAVRFLSVLVPFLAIIMGLEIHYLYKKIKSQRLKLTYIIAISIVLLFELIYSINTNFLKSPFSTSSWVYSTNKIQSLGFNQVDTFIRDTVIDRLPSKNNIKTKDDLIFNSDDIKGRSVIIFDDRINWYAQMWYFQRYFLYYRWPVISTAFLSLLGDNKITVKDLMEVSNEPLYFVYPIDDMVMDPVRITDPKINSIGPNLERQFKIASTTSVIIKNRNNIPVFKIYRLDKYTDRIR